MAVHDRDYMRSGAPRAAWLPGKVTWWIIGINVGMWILFSGAYNHALSQSVHATPLEPGGLYGFLSEYFVLHPRDVFGKWRLWEPFTAFWMHSPQGFSHVFYNMLMLFFFGQAVESWLGRRGYLRLYLGGGLASTLALVLTSFVTSDPRPALGASGCVYAVMVWTALQNPRRTVYLFFILPVPIWLVVGVMMVGMEFYALADMGLNAGSAIGHLSGGAWGLFVYAVLPRFPSRRAAPAGSGAWMVDLRRRRGEEREQLREQIVRDRERVEALLQKISDDGIGTLTEEEKTFLQEASKRYR